MYKIQSTTIHLYSGHLLNLSPQQIKFVDEVYKMCEDHYDSGGDTVVECYGPAEILEEFETLAEVRDLCKLRVEQESNCRWGEDNDPEVGRMQRADQW